jgi:hypothetical protein
MVPRACAAALNGCARWVISGGNTVLRQLLMGELPLVHASGCECAVRVWRSPGQSDW